MKEEFGLLVDTPRAGGSGTSNTGNTARRAFQNEEKFAEILEVDQRLIHRLHVMLIAINANISLDVNAFQTYARDTAKLWTELYPKFYMPVSIHILLIHGWESLAHSPLPDSFFTEQSLESTNKTFKHDRAHHSRRDSRLHTIMDQFDRYISKNRLI